MASSNHEYSESPAAAASTAWLISFGDLLTLLVCFFLVLTPWKTASPSINPAKSSISSSFNDVIRDGTSLAIQSVGPKPGVVAEMPVLASQLNTEGLMTLEMLKRDLALWADHRGAVALRLCDGEHREKLLREFGPALKAAVLDVGEFHIEIAGNCRQFEVLYPTSGDVVGAIRIFEP